MLKKCVIAGLAVAVGVAVLAFVSPKLFSLMMYTGGQISNGIDEASPPETELDRIKSELDGVEKEKPKLFHKIAVEELQLKKLEATIAANQKELDPLDKNATELADLLERDRTAVKVSFNGHMTPRDNVLSALNAAVELRDAKRAELQANQEQHDQSVALLDQHNKQLNDFNATIANMQTRLKAVDVKIQKARTAQANAPALATNDDRLSRAKADLDKLDDRATVMAREAQLAGASSPKATTPAAPSEDDLLKRARNSGDQTVDPGKTAIADKP